VYQKKDHTSQKHIVTKSNNIDISNQKSLLEITNKLINLIGKGDNLFLYGDIGVGKTTFTKFLINNLQTKNKLIKSEVLSPTFNILNEYQIKNLNVKHFDLYRVKNKEELNNLGLFEDTDSLKIIEWPEILESININKIEFHFSYSNDFQNRNLIIAANYKNKIIDEFK
tara:strand:+ start:17 stop:523 length:507 start_codon:yes stop_codon:yes gene_type:complete